MSFVRFLILKQNFTKSRLVVGTSIFFEKSLSGDFFVRISFELLCIKYFCSNRRLSTPTYILEEKVRADRKIFSILPLIRKGTGEKHDQSKFGTSLTFPKFGKTAEARQFKILAPAEFGFPRAKFKRVLDFVTANSFRCCCSIRLLLLLQRIAKKEFSQF